MIFFSQKISPLDPLIPTLRKNKNCQFLKFIHQKFTPRTPSFPPWVDPLIPTLRKAKIVKSVQN